MRRMCKMLTLVLLALFTVGLANVTRAQPSSCQGPADQACFYIRGDRPAYLPGDGGTLFITIRNQGTQAFTVKNLTVTFSWLSYLGDHWDGNYTINNINKALATAQSYNTQQGFTVPNDGRTVFPAASVSVTAGTDIGGDGGRYASSSADISIAAASYQPLGFITSILPLVTIGLLAVIAVVMTFVLVAIRKMAKK